MSRDETTPGELSDFERQLQSLRPNSAALDRDRLMFLAGAVQARLRSQRPWLLASTNVLSALAAGLVVAVVWRPAPRVVERIVYRPASPVNAPSPTVGDGASGPYRADPSGYFKLRERVLSGQWNDERIVSFAQPREESPSAPSYGELLRSFSRELR